MASARTWVWVDEVALRLALHAASGVPGALSRRLEEEWASDLAGLSHPFARLRFALGCWRAAFLIAREQPVTVRELPVRPASAGAPLPLPRSATLTSGIGDDCAFFRGGAIAYLMIAALLGGLLCALAFGVRV